jgi:hypothetical protein
MFLPWHRRPPLSGKMDRTSGQGNRAERKANKQITQKRTELAASAVAVLSDLSGGLNLGE